MDLYLVRHPLPDVEPGTCYGQTDLDVTPAALAAAATHAGPLLPAAVAAWYSSPLRRARKLADALRAERPDEGPLTEDPRLMELDFGAWEGLAWDDLQGPAFDAWERDFVATAPPGGEPWGALHERAGAWLAGVQAAGPSPVVAVTHGGIIHSVVARVLGLPLDNCLRVEVPFGSVTHLRLEADERLSRLVGLG
jgi:alpha-ribazole phosphatase